LATVPETLHWAIEIALSLLNLMSPILKESSAFLAADAARAEIWNDCYTSIHARRMQNKCARLLFHCILGIVRCDLNERENSRDTGAAKASHAAFVSNQIMGNLE
jgi:hypothetical protein